MGGHCSFILTKDHMAKTTNGILLYKVSDYLLKTSLVCIVSCFPNQLLDLCRIFKADASSYCLNSSLQMGFVYLASEALMQVAIEPI